MGLLPCLRRGRDRWWLPRSSTATDAIGMVLLEAGRGHALPHQVDDRTRQIVRSAIVRDPPLLIYAALCWPGDRAEPAELADWLIENLIRRFASGDAFLGAPVIDTEMHQRWRRLRDHYRTLPFHDWLRDAPLWLQVTGPQVADTWRQQWPQLDAGDEEAVPLEQPHECMLQQLARMMQRQRALEQSYDQRVKRTKLGALKQLAYGLSHEINNPLANISTRAQQLQRGEDDATRSAILQRIVDQVYRAHEMIADLMFYANPPDAKPSRCDLNPVLTEVVQRFQEEAERQAIRLETELPADPTSALIDATMISEAVAALVRNSIDAIGCQGTIVVSLVSQNGRLLIHVADSGPGLSEQARQHAFDPYFSGREAGRGLGLGLCRAYRIARMHDGDVTLAGGPAGCVATIWLPG